MMRVLGIIPARWAASRFPGKMLHPVCGRPLLHWVVDAARRAREIQDVRVATDDVRIARSVEALPVEVVMTRADHRSGTDRVAEAARAADDDIIVNLQGDEPLMPPAVIDGLVREMKADAQWNMATVATPIREAWELDAPSVVKVVTDATGTALYFSRCPIPCCRDGRPDLAAGLHLRHIGIYAYRGAFLNRLVREPVCPLERIESLEQLRALFLGARIRVIRAEVAGLGVDTPEDVPRVEARMRAAAS